MRNTSFRSLSALTLLAAALAAPAVASNAPARDSFSVTDVRVFDGKKAIPHATVVVRNGEIVAVGQNVHAPHDLPQIDGTGSTLLPGFIDSHGHSRDRSELVRSAQFGVTTLMDMWSLPRYVARMKREQERGRATDRADMWSAISPATLPEGYPYNFTPDEIEEPTLSSAAEADDFVDARFAEGSDYLKLMIEDLSVTTPFTIPTLDAETVRALTRATHRHHRLAVAHVTKGSLAQLAVDNGIDALVHVFVDEPISSALVAKIKRKGIFVVPTLSVEESFVDASGGAEVVADPDLGPYLTADEIAYLLSSPGLLTAEQLEIAKANVAALRAVGVPLLSGTDSPIYGAALHRDLELLTLAGLSPREALTGATSAAADAYGLSDRGRIAPGYRADLLLVDGNPLDDIKATRRIRHIWKTGVEIERPLPSLFGAANRSAASTLSPVCGHGH